MGDNQPTGPLDLDEAAKAFSSESETENEEREDLEDEADAEDDGSDEESADEDGEQESGEDDEEESLAPEKGRSYTVKVDGKETQVSERELIDGYQRQADYTRKSMALAEERKAHEAELATVRAERQQMAHWAQQMLAKLKREAPPEPNWDELRANDPIGFAATWAEHQRYREQQAVLVAQYDEVMRKNANDEQQALAKTIAAEGERLIEALPHWKDKEKAGKEKQLLLEYGRKMGFSDDELDHVYDHRTVLVLRKAMLYDRLQSKRPEVTQALRPTRPVLVNGNAPRRQHSEAIRAAKRLEKTGSIDDAAAAFKRFL